MSLLCELKFSALILLNTAEEVALIADWICSTHATYGRETPMAGGGLKTGDNQIRKTRVFFIQPSENGKIRLTFQRILI